METYYHPDEDRKARHLKQEELEYQSEKLDTELQTRDEMKTYPTCKEAIDAAREIAKKLNVPQTVYRCNETFAVIADHAEYPSWLSNDDNPGMIRPVAIYDPDGREFA